MSRQRRRFGASEKVKIIREHLVDKRPLATSRRWINSRGGPRPSRRHEKPNSPPPERPVNSSGRRPDENVLDRQQTATDNTTGRSNGRRHCRRATCQGYPAGTTKQCQGWRPPPPLPFQTVLESLMPQKTPCRRQVLSLNRKGTLSNSR